ncbi:MAG: UDP-glucose--hexose-1-phosphate uridylyltransferase [Oscillospiraceae bacterium]|nr:UDP-glucose--hexose-1-phosphate uridylyltransferase [Oscillospiraceae bacterium]MBQ8789192.1 UDP-glucose--hexose-1-phosphate uridylyltransferase [Oscillospiraceae bacterium]
MKIETYIDALVSYAMNTGLAEPEDHWVLVNRILDILQKPDYEPSDEPQPEDIEEILGGILDYAVENGLCDDNITAKDIFDTRIMGAVTPMPREIVRTFWEKYEKDPVEATDWYYKFSCDTDYIRRYRIEKDMRWKYPCEYGELDVTINLSKPEKDPKAIAAAKFAPQTAYPKCQLCRENEGYAGRMNHPARSNHRIIPIEICGADWCLQYSPYVYYNEHCIVLNEEHIPMKIDKSAFEKLLDFVRIFPHYFVGSNADLPIVGGSILSHEHFQGGHYVFAMETAPVKEKIVFKGFEDIEAGIVKWPMSVIRLRGADSARIAELADKILGIWRGYSDESVSVIAFSEGQPHNTITPIARRRGEDYELDLVLRCNITTEEHPLGVFHPHADKHHIKKENIGLIEVMGLAVLPSRLKKELSELAEAAVSGKDVYEDENLSKHAEWLSELKKEYTFTEENAMDIILKETGKVFAEVLEDAGVYKNTAEGNSAFIRFIDAVNKEAN